MKKIALVMAFVASVLTISLPGIASAAGRSNDNYKVISWTSYRVVGGYSRGENRYRPRNWQFWDRNGFRQRTLGGHFVVGRGGFLRFIPNECQ